MDLWVEFAFVNTSNLTAFDTGDLTEGSNLYYTDARAQAVSINNVVEDTTPQLGGTLDTNGNDIQLDFPNKWCRFIQ